MFFRPLNFWLIYRNKWPVINVQFYDHFFQNWLPFKKPILYLPNNIWKAFFLLFLIAAFFFLFCSTTVINMAKLHIRKLKFFDAYEIRITFERRINFRSLSQKTAHYFAPWTKRFIVCLLNVFPHFANELWTFQKKQQQQI